MSGPAFAPWLPRVKVCGVTRPGDAARAVELGAAAIGMIFWPGSPRAIDVATARAIAREVPPLIATVGVFVDEDPAAIARVADAVPLAVVQLHGDEPPDVLAQLARPVIKAMAPSAPGAEARAARWPAWVTLLLDAHDPGRRGGTGQTADWTIAAAWAHRRRVVLSGGLHAGNVREAIARVQPWAVDVASGVESAPGVKDAARLSAFFHAVAAAAESAGEERA